MVTSSSASQDRSGVLCTERGEDGRVGASQLAALPTSPRSFLGTRLGAGRSRAVHADFGLV